MSWTAEEISILENHLRHVSISHWGMFPLAKWDEYNQRWVWLPFLVEE